MRLEEIKEKKEVTVDVVFYFVVSFAISLAACWGILMAKVFLQQNQIKHLDTQVAQYNTQDRQAKEKMLLEYKKKIDDFSVLLGDHRYSSNIFELIEKTTLPNVWFSNFAIQEEENSVQLSGQTENLESLSRQVHRFEDSPYISKVVVLNSEAQEQLGKVQFSVSISLNRDIFFGYNPALQKKKESGAQGSPVPESIQQAQ
jgi:hypothetical protein